MFCACTLHTHVRSIINQIIAALLFILYSIVLFEDIALISKLMHAKCLMSTQKRPIRADHWATTQEKSHRYDTIRCKTLRYWFKSVAMTTYKCLYAPPPPPSFYVCWSLGTVYGPLHTTSYHHHKC